MHVLTSSCNGAFRNVRRINERHFVQLKLGDFAAQTKLETVNRTYSGCMLEQIEPVLCIILSIWIILHCQNNDFINLIMYMKLNAALVQVTTMKFPWLLLAAGRYEIPIWIEWKVDISPCADMGNVTDISPWAYNKLSCAGHIVRAVSFVSGLI